MTSTVKKLNLGEQIKEKIERNTFVQCESGGGYLINTTAKTMAELYNPAFCSLCKGMNKHDARIDTSKYGNICIECFINFVEDREYKFDGLSEEDVTKKLVELHNDKLARTVQETD